MTIIRVNGSVPSGNKPLPKWMLTKIYGTIWPHWVKYFAGFFTKFYLSVFVSQYWFCTKPLSEPVMTKPYDVTGCHWQQRVKYISNSQVTWICPHCCTRWIHDFVLIIKVTLQMPQNIFFHVTDTCCLQQEEHKPQPRLVWEHETV